MSWQEYKRRAGKRTSSSRRPATAMWIRCSRKENSEHEKRFLTCANGVPVSDNQNSITAGEARPDRVRRLSPVREARALQPRADPERVVHAKGSGAFGTLSSRHQGHHAAHEGRAVLEDRQADAAVPAVLDGRRRGRVRRHRARSARLRDQALHRAGDLGSRRQQHAGVLHPRPVEVPRLHPHAEAPSADPPEGRDDAVGLLVLAPRVAASSDDPVSRIAASPTAIASWMASAATRSA